jgi:AraC family transcriptional regulator
MRTPVPQYEYQRRVHRVVNHIGHNFSRQLELDSLAAISGFSPYHFHRLFTAVTGEPMFRFIHRLRVELGATLLCVYRELPIGHIADEVGFSSQASFARAFREHFRRTPSEWRQGGFWWHNGRHWQWRTSPKDDESRRPTEPRPDAAEDLDSRLVSLEMLAQARKGKQWQGLGKIQVEDIRSFRIAYMRRRGPEDVESTVVLWQRFMRWIAGRQMTTRDSVVVAFSQDNVNIVAPAHCRHDVGVIVDSDFQPGDDDVLDIEDIPGSKYVVADITGTLYEEPLAAEYLWSYWLPYSGLQQQTYGPVFRRFHATDLTDRPLTPETVFSYQLCIPVKRFNDPLVRPEIIVEPFRLATGG